MKKLVVAVAAVLGLACGPDPKQLVVTEKNVETFEEAVKASAKVTPEEKRLVERFMARRREEQAAGVFAKAMGVDGKITAIPLGKTVAAIIGEQRALEKAVADEQARVATIKRNLEAALEVKLVSVGPRTQYGIWLVDIELECRNLGKAPIRGFKGTLLTTSLMGDTLREFTIADELGISPNEIRRISRSGAGGEKFAAVLDPKDLQWKWEPTAILFGDGTMVSAELPAPAPKE